MATAISKRIAEVSTSFRDRLQGVCGRSLVSMFLGIAPAPASRPRVTKFGGVYYGAPYKRFYEAVKDWFIDGDPRKEIEGPILMMIEVLVEKPKTGKLDYPRGDLDNFAKGPLDAFTNKLWEGRPVKDDNQVVGLMVFKRYAEPNEEPGVRMEYAPL